MVRGISQDERKVEKMKMKLIIHRKWSSLDLGKTSMGERRCSLFLRFLIIVSIRLYLDHGWGREREIRLLTNTR